MDPQIEELKELVRQNTALTQETNAIVKSIHRASVWGRVLKFVWIGLIVAVSVGSLVYLAPYLAQMQAFIENAQEAIDQAKQIGSQLQGGGR